MACLLYILHTPHDEIGYSSRFAYTYMHMEELTFDGKIYLSTKRAGELTGYAKDYVGQLARGGKIDARLVGRNWYVHKESIIAHKQGGKEIGDDLTYTATIPEEVRKPWEVTWGAPQYSTETNNEEENEEVEVPPLLVSERKEVPKEESAGDMQTEHAVLEEMQEMWQRWGRIDHHPLQSTEAELVKDEVKEEQKEQEEEELVEEEKSVPITVISPYKEKQHMVIKPIQTMAVSKVSAEERHPSIYVKRGAPALHVAVLALAIILSGNILYVIAGGSLGEFEENKYVSSVANFLSGNTSFERD